MKCASNSTSKRSNNENAGDRRFGPGTATAVAEKFGSEGFSTALIGRNEERLAQGVAALKARGIDAFAFPGDAGNESSIRSALRSVREHMGPITVMQWNAYGAMDAGDLLTANVAALHAIFDVAVFGLLAAVEEALPDLKQNNGAILIQNGGFGLISPEVDAYSTSSRVMGFGSCECSEKQTRRFARSASERRRRLCWRANGYGLDQRYHRRFRQFGRPEGHCREVLGDASIAHRVAGRCQPSGGKSVRRCKECRFILARLKALAARTFARKLCSFRDEPED
jgi:hypothetical protein